MPGASDREGSRSAFSSRVMEEGQAQGQRERQGGWSCAHRRVRTTRMHNDVVKLRAGAVQREANHAGRSYLNLDSTLPARQLQLHVLCNSARKLHWKITRLRLPRCHQDQQTEAPPSRV